TMCWRRDRAVRAVRRSRRPPRRTASRRTSTSASKRAKRRCRDSAGTAASHCTLARTTARSVVRPRIEELVNWRIGELAMKCAIPLTTSPTHQVTNSPIGLESMREYRDGVSGHRQDLDERQVGGVEGCDDPYRLARPPLRERRVRRRALLRHAQGLGLLPPRHAHAPPPALRQDLPHGIPPRPGRVGGRGAQDDPRERDEGLLHPAGHVPRLRGARRQPAHLPGRRGDPPVGVGTYLGQEALEQGVDVKISSWSRMAPNTLPAMAKSAANYANSALIKMEAL